MRVDDARAFGSICKAYAVSGPDDAREAYCNCGILKGQRLTVTRSASESRNVAKRRPLPGRLVVLTT